MKITTRKLTKASQLSNRVAELLPTICEQTDRQTQAADRHRPTVRQNSYRQTDIQTDRHRDRQTDKAADRELKGLTHTHKHRLEEIDQRTGETNKASIPS